MNTEHHKLERALLEIKMRGDGLNRRAEVADGEDFWDAYNAAAAALSPQADKARGEVRLSLCDGKYEVVREADGDMYATRYGEFWRVLTGDHLVAALMEAALSTPQARPDGGDFYDILYGAKITLILNAGDDASGEVPLTVGATVGTESDLTILCHAEKDGKPITLSVDPQADVARMVATMKRMWDCGHSERSVDFDSEARALIAALNLEPQE